TVYFMTRKSDYSTDSKPTLKQAIATFVEAIPSLFLIVVVIGGIILGIFTATEASGIAVIYSLILALAYKQLTWSSPIKTLKETIIMTCIVLCLLATSSIMSWVMSLANIPRTITNVLLSFSDNPIIILLLMNIILLVVGMFLDIPPAILIFS